MSGTRPILGSPLAISRATCASATALRSPTWTTTRSDGGLRKSEGRSMTRRDVDRSDIQAFAYTAFGTLTGATYLLLRVVDAPAARRFLGALNLASVVDLQKGAEPVDLAEATQCAATAAGL